jgi:GNAT superfamily N-acetyltransferase
MPSLGPVSDFDCCSPSDVFSGLINEKEVTIHYAPTVLELDLFLDESRSSSEKCKRVYGFFFYIHVCGENIGHAKGNYQMQTKSPIKQQWQKTATLDYIEIKPSHRGQGYGAVLLLVLLECMKSIDCISLIAKKAKYSEALVRFYSRAGFKIEGRQMIIHF